MLWIKKAASPVNTCASSYKTNSAMATAFCEILARRLQRPSVLHRFGHMRHLHRLRADQVRNGACHFQAAVNAAG